MWWHAIAPVLERRWRVIAIDLSGHGDSGRRQKYNPEHWVTEVNAVLDAVGSEHPVFVGHSMGSRVGMAFAAFHPDRLAGLIVLDSAVDLPEPLTIEPRTPAPALKTYPTEEEIVARFRLKPSQPMPGGDITDPVAHFSVLETEDGWRWKHDPTAVLHRIENSFLESLTDLVVCPVGIIYAAESGLIDRALVDSTARLFTNHVETIEIENAHHHLILDQPSACAAAIERLASGFLGRAD